MVVAKRNDRWKWTEFDSTRQLLASLLARFQECCEERMVVVIYVKQYKTKLANLVGTGAPILQKKKGTSNN